MRAGWLVRLSQVPRQLMGRLRTLLASVLVPAPGASPLLQAASAYGDVGAPSAQEPEPKTRARDAKVAGAAMLKQVAFWGLQAPPDLSPSNYQSLFSLLQRLPGSKVLDFSPARLLSVDVFDALARAWTASGERVPRLALVFSFERWVMFLRPALEALHPIIGCGVEVVIAYKEQLTGGQLAHWFSHGELRHNAPAAIATLRQGWQPDASWPNVIHTLADLVREHSRGHEAAVLFAELASLALHCNGPEFADPLAREALLYLTDLPSATRSRALRHLGAALVRVGRTAEGLETLDLAISAGVQSDRPVVAANPLYQRGQHALDQGDLVGAERRFRSALALLEGDRRRCNLRRRVHRGLAIILARQGQPEAEYHARQAVALHQDPTSEQAVVDRQLLGELIGTLETN